jgi:hypothetical protein
MSNIHNVLYENEKILWEGKPESGPYIVGGILGSIPVAIFGLFFAGLVVVIAFQGRHTPMNWAIFLMPHFWIGLMMIFGPTFSTLFSYSRIAYAITDRRVLIESGIFVRNIQTIDIDQISNATVNTSMVDEWFGGTTGTVMLSGGLAAVMNIMVMRAGSAMSRFNCLLHIKDPYTVFKFFEKLELDTKTDMEYPNALRPGSNPGYQTVRNTEFPK